MNNKGIPAIRRPLAWTAGGLVALALLGMIADVVYMEAEENIIVGIVLSVCILGILYYFAMRFLHRER